MTDSLIARAKAAAAEADEIFWRQGAASGIETLMKVAADSTERGYYCNAKGYIKEAEDAAAGSDQTARQALIEGYRRLIEICWERSRGWRKDEEAAKYARIYKRRFKELQKR